MPANSLKQRVVTAVVVVAVLLPSFLILPKDFGLALIAIFVLGAAWEWGGFMGLPGPGPRAAYVALTAGLMWLGLRFVPASLAAEQVAATGLVWWLTALILILRFPVAFARPVVLGSGLMVLLPAFISLAALLEAREHGRGMLLLALAIVWAADVGAYFAGRSLGRVKLAPRVSPGKTWEGAIGGLLCAAATAAVGAILLGQPVVPALPLGMSVAGISIVGDLTVSMFKRNAGLKDSGNLFPGHGGVLDRVDSVTAAAPLFLLQAGWLGWLDG